MHAEARSCSPVSPPSREGHTAHCQRFERQIAHLIRIILQYRPYSLHRSVPIRHLPPCSDDGYRFQIRPIAIYPRRKAVMFGIEEFPIASAAPIIIAS